MLLSNSFSMSIPYKAHSLFLLSPLNRIFFLHIIWIIGTDFTISEVFHKNIPLISFCFQMIHYL